jgi:uridine kinase
LREVRYGRYGRRSAAGYYEDAYDFQSFVESTLRPLGPGGDRRYRPAVIDLENDRPLGDNVVELAQDGVLVVDGSFLQKPETDGFWDIVLYVDTPFSVARLRGINRDEVQLGGAKSAGALYDDRYHAAARMYLDAVGPKERANLVLDNTNVDAPTLTVQKPFEHPGPDSDS